MTGRNYSAVYDFELYPYALGDVLTWNVQTAIRCEELGREKVDAYICLDERQPASIFQRDLVTAENCALFFNELFGAFGTHPALGNLHIFRRREELLEKLREEARADEANREALEDYERALDSRDDEDAMIACFSKNIHFHDRINAFSLKHRRIPQLQACLGCEPDVTGLLAKRFGGKRIVVVHMRLRRLDAGFGAQHTFWRDSDFLEWYEFLKETGKTHPDVQFVVPGRLQEKPLEILRLPNVTSLRTMGLGLGHELTLILKSDLFLGTSSGFAAMAYFSNVPYFMTNMNQAACSAYRIMPGTEKLPFAGDRQFLDYEPETRALLAKLLVRGLDGVPPRSGSSGPPLDGAVDVRSWEWERSQWLHPGASTSRFSIDDQQSDKETGFLVWPRVKEARTALRKGLKDRTREILARIEEHFPRLCAKFPEFLALQRALALTSGELAVADRCEAQLRLLLRQDPARAGISGRFARYLRWGYPSAMWLKHVWQRKHRIPKRGLKMLMALLRKQ